MKIMSGFLGVLLFSATASAAPVTLQGTIGKARVTFQVELQTGPVSGSYQYDRVKQPIRLEGTLAADGTLTLNEHGGDKDAVSGTLSGHWDGKAFTGQWKSPDGKKVLEVRLAAPVADSTFLTTPRSVQLCDPELPALVTVTYQLIDPADASSGKVNPAIEAAVFEGLDRKKMAKMAPCKDVKEDEPGNYTTQINASLEAGGKGLVLMRQSSESEGGAHPSGSQEVIYFDRASGKRYANTDFFTAKGLKAVDRLVAAAVKEMLKESQCDSGFESLAKQGTLDFSSGSMKVVFSDYEVAPRVCAPGDVDIPWEKVKGYLAPGGPIQP